MIAILSAVMFWPSLKPDMLRTPQLQLHYEEDYRRVPRMLQKNATPRQAVKSSSAENERKDVNEKVLE